MARVKKAQSGANVDSTKYFMKKMDSVRTAEKKSGKGITPASEKAFNDAATGYKRQLTKPKAKDGGKWMQKAAASIKRRGTEGKCTPITKPGCTGKAKALAKTFKKIAAKRKSK